MQGSEEDREELHCCSLSKRNAPLRAILGVYSLYASMQSLQLYGPRPSHRQTTHTQHT